MKVFFRPLTRRDCMGSDCILITCPACGFSKALPSSKFPSKPLNLSCSQCKASFLFEAHLVADSVEPKLEASLTAKDSEQVSCPKCGYQRNESDDGLVDSGTCPKCHI